MRWALGLYVLLVGCASPSLAPVSHGELVFRCDVTALNELVERTAKTQMCTRLEQRIRSWLEPRIQAETEGFHITARVNRIGKGSGQADGLAGAVQWRSQSNKNGRVGGIIVPLSPDTNGTSETRRMADALFLALRAQRIDRLLENRTDTINHTVTY